MRATKRTLGMFALLLGLSFIAAFVLFFYMVIMMIS